MYLIEDQRPRGICLASSCLAEVVSMKCYFYGTGQSGELATGEGGVISFAVPDIGVVYRTRAQRDRLECEYLALIALLEFLDSNSSIMANQVLEILGDSAVVVYQLNGKMPVFSRVLKHYRRIEQYRRRLRFKVSWTPQSMNRAAMTLPNLPPLSAEMTFDFSFAKKKPGDRPDSPLLSSNSTFF